MLSPWDAICYSDIMNWLKSKSKNNIPTFEVSNNTSFYFTLFFFCVSLNRKRNKKHVKGTTSVRRKRIVESFGMHSMRCDCIEFIELKSFPEKWSKVNKMCIADSKIRFVTHFTEIKLGRKKETHTQWSVPHFRHLCRYYWYYLFSTECCNFFLCVPTIIFLPKN